MNQFKARHKQVPADMRSEFKKLMEEIKKTNINMSRSQLWEYSWKIQNAVTFADWQIFKQNYGLR